MNRPSHASLSLAVPGLVLLLAACGPQSPPPDEPAEPTAAIEPAEGTVDEPEPRSYEVRGEVRAVSEEEGIRLLKVKHEAIDDLVGLDGKIWGMDAMTMDFPVAPDVSLDGIEEGDKIAMTLVVDWLGPVAQQLTRVDELPPETALEYREARPPEEADAPDPEASGAEAGDDPASGGTG